MMDQPDTSMMNEGGFHQNEPASRAYIPPQPELRAPLSEFDQRLDPSSSRSLSKRFKRRRAGAGTTAVVIGTLGAAGALWLARGGTFRKNQPYQKAVERIAKKVRPGRFQSVFGSRLKRDARRLSKKSGFQALRKQNARPETGGMVLGLLGVATAIAPIVWFSRNNSSGMMDNRLERMSFQRVYEQARKLNIPGRSVMNKNELIEAIREQRQV